MADPVPAPRSRPWWHWLLLTVTAPCLVMIGVAQTAAWWWCGELCSHWSLHAAVATMPALAVFGRDPRWGRILMAIAAIALLPWVRASFAPRALIERDDRRPVVRIELASANLRANCETHAASLQAISEQHPEVCALIEATAEDQRALAEDARWPHQVWSPCGNGCMVALLSVRRVVWSKIHMLEGMAAVEALIDLGDGPLRVFAVHLVSPRGAILSAQRDRELAALSRVVAERQEPMVVMGDFNLSAGSPFWPAFLAATHLRPAPGREPATWPWFLGPFGIGIDHVLARDAALDGLRAFTLPGSDHRGVAASGWVPVGER